MPYKNEYSKHKAVTDILNNQKLKNYFENMQLHKMDFEEFPLIDDFCYFEKKLGKKPFLKDIQSYLKNSQLDIEYVFSFDGSNIVLSLNDYMDQKTKGESFLYPGSEIGLVKISQTFIDLSKVDDFEKNEFPFVADYKDIYVNSSFDCLVPGFNISNKEYPEPKDFLRKSIYSYLKYTHNPFVDFLENKFVENPDSSQISINRITLLDTFRNLVDRSDGLARIKNICNCEREFILKDFFLPNYHKDDMNHNMIQKQINELKTLIENKPNDINYFEDVVVQDHYTLLQYQKKLSLLKENIEKLFHEYEKIFSPDDHVFSELKHQFSLLTQEDQDYLNLISAMEKNIEKHLEQFEINLRKKRNQINKQKIIDKNNYSDYLGNKIIGMKKCQCEKEVFITDVLNFHESFQSLNSSDGFYNEIMLFIEKLSLLNLFETIEKNILNEELRKKFFQKTIFLMDGPLAIYNQGKWLTKSIKERIEYFVKTYDISLIGVEKSGHFYDHLNMMNQIKMEKKKSHLNPGFLFFLNDQYIKKYIRNMNDMSQYGESTYFGKKAFYKNLKNELFILNLNYLDLKEEKAMFNERNSKKYINQQKNLSKILYIFERYHSKRFHNALSLTSLAHENASLSNKKISKKLLETYFNFLLKN